MTNPPPRSEDQRIGPSGVTIDHASPSREAGFFPADVSAVGRNGSGIFAIAGCIQSRGPTAAGWKRSGAALGSSPGRLFRPRAIAIDKSDLLYIVDMTPQIQVFTGDGDLVRSWQPPKFDTGKPSGLTFDNAGNLLVADTHNYRILVYTPEGKLLEDQTFGGVCGNGDGEFRFVTDAAQDAKATTTSRNMATTTGFKNSRPITSSCSPGASMVTSWDSFCAAEDRR